jgi:hypothetical protein
MPMKQPMLKTESTFRITNNETVSVRIWIEPRCIEKHLAPGEALEVKMGMEARSEQIDSLIEIEIGLSNEHRSMTIFFPPGSIVSLD